VEQRLERERRAGGALERLYRHRGTDEIARHDPRDAFAGEPPRESLGLRHAARRERDVGTLHDAERVARGLAVTQEKDHRRSLSR
jgi:hypothetical protein